MLQNIINYLFAVLQTNIKYDIMIFSAVASFEKSHTMIRKDRISLTFTDNFFLSAVKKRVNVFLLPFFFLSFFLLFFLVTQIINRIFLISGDVKELLINFLSNIYLICLQDRSCQVSSIHTEHLHYRFLSSYW